MTDKSKNKPILTTLRFHAITLIAAVVAAFAATSSASLGWPVWAMFMGWVAFYTRGHFKGRLLQLSLPGGRNSHGSGSRAGSRNVSPRDWAIGFRDCRVRRCDDCCIAASGRSTQQHSSLLPRLDHLLCSASRTRSPRSRRTPIRQWSRFRCGLVGIPPSAAGGVKEHSSRPVAG